MKKLIAAVVALALAAGGFFGLRWWRNSRKVVKVMPVGNLSMGYWGDETSYEGMVIDAETQYIYADPDKRIDQVYVTAGQTVKAGDPLLSYDMTSLEIALEMQKLDIQTYVTDIAKAQRELEKLRNTTPVEPTPDPVDPVDPDDPDDPEENKPKKKGEAWDKLLGLDQAQIVEDIYLGADPACDATEPDCMDDQEAVDDSEGPIGKRYRFLVTEDAAIYGSFFNETAGLEPSDMVLIETSKDNSFKTSSAVWEFHPSRMPVLNETESWDIHGDPYVPAEEPSEEEDIPEDEEFPGEEEFQPTYTAEELKRAIEYQERLLRDLDLDRRKAELDLKELEDEMSDGIVRAKRDGVVVTAHGADEIMTDGEEFLQVSSGTGVYIQGTVSELQLDRITPGQTVYARSWMTDANLTAVIQSIDSWPVTQQVWGQGNPNVSYYYFTAYAEDAENMNAGDYLSLTFDSANMDYANKITLSTGYVRNEGGRKYVMMDDNGILRKQYVTTGKIYYGEVIEITGGLTMENCIAFPYGDGAIEGVKTEVTEDYGGFY
ncbi:MAG: biotin/lipoyl-binding protein [Solobacterium sp.]|nr:biotin/lipoyl-binding protein [Solobacterium sp.]